MSKRAYLSEASKWWNLARQREALSDVLREEQNETVYVASLAVLAERDSQLTAVLDALAARGSVLPEIGLEAWKEAWRRSRLERAALRGAKVSANRRKAKSQAGVDRIKDRWKLSTKEHPTKSLLVEAGVSRNTIKAVLGFTREEYQARYQAALKRRTRKVSST